MFLYSFCSIIPLWTCSAVVAVQKDRCEYVHISPRVCKLFSLRHHASQPWILWSYRHRFHCTMVFRENVEAVLLDASIVSSKSSDFFRIKYFTIFMTDLVPSLWRLFFQNSQTLISYKYYALNLDFYENRAPLQ